MHRLLNHLRSQAIAYLALFIALGGTGYAATRLPAGSVGSRQLRNGAVTNKKLANGSVTPAKLNAKDIAGSIAMWARVSASGTVIASKPQAQVVGWNPVDGGGQIHWGKAIPTACFSLATVDGLGAMGFATTDTFNLSKPSAFVSVGTINAAGHPAAEPFNVAVICP